MSIIKTVISLNLKKKTKPKSRFYILKYNLSCLWLMNLQLETRIKKAHLILLPVSILRIEAVSPKYH